MMQGPNGGSPKTPPIAPQKPNKGVRRMRPESWQNSNSEIEITVPVPVNPYQRPRKQQPVGGLTNLAVKMTRGIVPVPVNDNLTNENVNAIPITNENLQNTSSYLDEIESLLQAYYPGYGKVHRERNGSLFIINTGNSQAIIDNKAQRDFMSLLGYINRIERDYVIPDSVSDFVKVIRSYEQYPEQVNEQLMITISQQIYPIFNEFAQQISRKTLTQLGPKKGGRRTRRNRNRHRQRHTHRRR